MSVESVESGDVTQSETLDFSELPQKPQDAKAQLGRANHVAHYYGSSIEPSPQLNTLDVNFSNQKDLLKGGMNLLGINQKSTKDYATTALLCFFLGIFGAHRFYVGKPITGLLMICTLGGFFGLWPLVDFIMILLGSFEDGEGKVIQHK